MKKKLAVLLLTLALLAGATACSGGGTSIVPEGPSAQEQSASEAASASDAEEGASNAEPSGGADTDGATLVPNPIVEYADIAALQEAVGFQMLYFPQVYGMTDAKFEVIGDTLAQARLKDTAGREITLRQSKGAEDISGIYGADYQTTTVGDVTVHSGKYEATSVAWWENGGYSYSVSVDNIEAKDFNDYIKTLVEGSISNLA